MKLHTQQTSTNLPQESITTIQLKDPQERKALTITVKFSAYGEVLSCKQADFENLPKEAIKLSFSGQNKKTILKLSDHRLASLQYLIPYLAFVKLPNRLIPDWLMPVKNQFDQWANHHPKIMERRTTLYPIQQPWIQSLYEHSQIEDFENHKERIFFHLLNLWSLDLHDFYDAVHWFANHKVQLALQPLMSRLNDEDTFIVRNICLALGKMKNPVAVDPLLEMLKEGNKTVQQLAATAIGDIGAESGIPELVSKLKSNDQYVRQVSVMALKKIGNPNVIDHLDVIKKTDPSEMVREYAMEAIHYLDEKSQPDTSKFY